MEMAGSKRQAERFPQHTPCNRADNRGTTQRAHRPGEDEHHPVSRLLRQPATISPGDGCLQNAVTTIRGDTADRFCARNRTSFMCCRQAFEKLRCFAASSPLVQDAAMITSAGTKNHYPDTATWREASLPPAGHRESAEEKLFHRRR
jgi:hypothetical protein